jgi:glycosyltransferase involved in cell wall biosynthesis
MLYRNGPLTPDSVYVIMPAFNEGPVIGSVIHRVRETLPDAHVVVINDGSCDNTVSAAAAAGARVVSLPFNCGYGVALQTGLTYALRAGAEIVVTMDSDGQHDPRSIESLITPVWKGESDLVLGSRYPPRSASYRVPALRRIVSHFLGLVLTLIAGQRLTDTTTGFQCLNRKTLGRFVILKDFPEGTPDADLILYAIMTGLRVSEVPVTMHEDQGGESMHGVFNPIFYIPKLLTAILSVLLQHSYQKGGWHDDLPVGLRDDAERPRGTRGPRVDLSLRTRPLFWSLLKLRRRSLLISGNVLPLSNRRLGLHLLRHVSRLFRRSSLLSRTHRRCISSAASSSSSS